MPTPPDARPHRPAARGPRPGWRRAADHGLLGVVLVGLTAWSACTNDAPAAPPGAAPPATLDRFRADAWFLPDDPWLGFVEIPAGPFLMGSDPATDAAAFDNERWSPAQPQGRVELPTFFLGRWEVTVAQFAAFVAETGAPVSPEALAGAPDHPVASVSWPDALAYCRWLDATLREWPETPPVLRDRLRDGWRITLPSEAEWEKGARGTDGRIYPWGASPRPERAHYGARAPRPVGLGECPECPFRLADMSGNVWELTRSVYRPYPFTDDIAVDPASLAADALFVMRGGSYVDQAPLVRAATRGGADPGVRRPFIGFRLALVGGGSS